MPTPDVRNRPWLTSTGDTDQHDRDILLRTGIVNGADSFEDLRTVSAEGQRQANIGEAYLVGCLKEAVGLVGNATVAYLDGLTPTLGDTYVLTDAGTPSAGSSDTLAAGDIAEWDGSSWKKVVANSGGFVPATAWDSFTAYRLAESGGTPLVAPYTEGVDNGKLVTFDGTSNTGATKALTPPDSPPYVKCRDQDDADTNACLSVWEIALRYADGTLADYDITGGSMWVDDELHGEGDVHPMPVGDRWKHRAYANGDPMVPVAMNGDRPFFDGYLYPSQGTWLPTCSVEVSKLLPAGVPVRFCVHYPNGAKQIHLARFVHQRHKEPGAP